MRYFPFSFHSMLAFTLLAAVTGGCSTSDSAQELALVTLKATASYEAEIDKKIAAEKKFYKDQLNTITARLGGQPTEKQLSGETLSEEKADQALQKSWLYWRIRTETARSGLLISGRILSQPPPLARGLMIEYLETGLQHDVNVLAQVRTKQQELATEFAKTLTPIENQKKRLKEIRKGLTTLASGGGDGDRLALALAFAKALKDEVKQ